MGDLFLEPLRQTARERVMPAYREVPIEPAALGRDVGLLGAVALFKGRNPVKNNPLAPELIEYIRQQVLSAYPEMEGAELTVAPRRGSPEQAAVAEKLGLPQPQEPAERLYTVTLRKEVRAEDGVSIPLIVRITVDGQGRIIKGREAH